MQLMVTNFGRSYHKFGSTLIETATKKLKGQRIVRRRRLESPTKRPFEKWCNRRATSSSVWPSRLGPFSGSGPRTLDCNKQTNNLTIARTICVLTWVNQIRLFYWMHFNIKRKNDESVTWLICLKIFIMISKLSWHITGS